MGRGPAKGKPPRPNTQVRLEQLEERATPQDMFGFLQAAVSVGGLPLMNGRLLTPQAVVMRGWAYGQPVLPPEVDGDAAGVAARPPALPETDVLGSLAGFSLAAGGGATQETSTPAAAPQAEAPAAADAGLADWLRQVGAVLGGQDSHAPQGPPAANGPANGGYGSGGSSPQTSGLNPPVAALANAGSSAGGNGAVAPAAVKTAAPATAAGGSAASAEAPAAASPQPGGTAATVAASAGGSVTTGTTGQSTATQATLAAYGQVPLAFELNAGQAGNASVLALSHGPGFGLWLTTTGLTFSLAQPGGQPAAAGGQDVFALDLVGANSQATVTPGGLLPGRSNYFVGGQSITDVAQYGSVTLNDVYPGIGLTLHSSAGSRAFEFDFDVAAGADPSQVQLGTQGLQGVRLDAQGNVELETPGGAVVMSQPVLYQTVGGARQDVAGTFTLGGDGNIGLRVTGAYDPAQPLVVDPQISFASYLGGSGDDYGYAVAVDPDGNTYVTGSTTSTDFPTQNPYQGSLQGEQDAFVSKLNASGSLVYSTYLGGGGVTASTGGGGSDARRGGGRPDVGTGSEASQAGQAVAVGPDGQAVVAGWTNASDFPTTAGAYQPTSSLDGTSSTVSAFVTKLNATGDALDWSTYLGSSNSDDSAQGVALDAEGNTYVAGVVGEGPLGGAPDFPTTSGAFQASFGGGDSDAFLTKLSGDGSRLVYSSFLGGSGIEGEVTSTGYGPSVAVDGSGDAYVAGLTTSSDFPVSGGAYQTSLSGSQDAFVAEVNPAGSSLTYGTYFGGSATTQASAVAVDRAGRAFFTGQTTSIDLPTTGGAYQRSLVGAADAFVAALGPSGASLVYSTYLGGGGSDAGLGIAVDGYDYATVTGQTGSTNFPVTGGAAQSTSGGGADAFVTQLTSTGTLSYSSYLGGSGADAGQGVAVDVYGDVYVAGYTNSTNFPTTAGAYQGSNAGGYDAFLAEVPQRGDAVPYPGPAFVTGISPDTGYSSGDGITKATTITLEGTAPAGTTVTLERADVGVLSAGIPVSTGGTWTYDYTGTTLPQGTYDFFAQDVNSYGVSNRTDKDYQVTVDETAPAVTLSAPGSTTSLTPQVRVTASDQVGLPPSATVTLDVNGSAYATATLDNGQASITLPALSGTGTYTLQAFVSDLAGNQGSSALATMTVTSASGWGYVLTGANADPTSNTMPGDPQAELGDVTLSQPLILDRSGEADQAGDPALVYHSSQVDAYPVVQVQVQTPNNASLPASIAARLTFNGVAAATVTYSTSGLAAGSTLTLALQSSTQVTTTGLYNYSVTVQPYGGSADTLTGSTFVVAEDGSALGAGWTFSGVDQLVAVTGGVLRVSGAGGYAFYAGSGSSFTSPAGDDGTLTQVGGTYTYSTPDGQSWAFNSGGYETGWASADGQETLAYRYDGSDRLSGMTAIDGAVTTFSYGPSGVTIQTVNGRTTTLTLSSNNLTAITNPDGGVVTLSYDAHHRLEQEQYGLLVNNWAYSSAGTLGTYTWGASAVGGVSNPSVTTVQPAITQGMGTLVAGAVYGTTTDPDGDTTKEAFDLQGNVVQTVAANGGVTSEVYTNGYVTSETDPLGRTTTYARDGLGYVTQETFPDGSMVTSMYQTAFHALTTMIDQRGETTTYAYDSEGHQIRETDPLGDTTTYSYYSDGLPEAVTDANGHTTTTTYDGDRRLSTATDPLGEPTTYTYDANGNPQTTTDALGRVTTTLYDVMGREVGTVNALGGRTTMTYDVSGLVLTSTDELGVETETSYDSFGRGLVVETLVGAGGTTQVTTLDAYDAAGQVTSSRDSTGWTSSQAYDGVGEVVSTTDADGDTTQTDYDLAGQVTAQRDEMGRWTYNAYNQVGEQVGSTDNLGNTTTMAYDLAGNRVSTTDPLGHTMTCVYDADNRQTVEIDPLGLRTTATYDPVGNVLTVTDPNGNVTSYSYDADDRQTTETTGVGSRTPVTLRYGYDAVGDRTGSTDGDGQTTTYAYDALGRETTSQTPLNQVTTTNYDVVGTPLTTVNALSQTTTYAYDSIGRPMATTNPLGATTTSILDADGKTAGMIDPTGGTSLALTLTSPAGQNVGSVDPLGKVTQTITAPDGSTRAVIDPDGNETDYVLDGDGRVTETITPTGTTTTTYNAAGRMTSTTDADDRVIQYSYDADDRQTGEVWKSSAGVTVNIQTFTYDNDGNLLTASDNSGTVTYTYDSQDRVQSTTGVWGVGLTYTYNGNGEVTQRTDSLGGAVTYVYDNASRLSSEQFSGTGPTGSVIRVDFGYDANNEQTTITWYSNLAGTNEVAASAYGYDSAGDITSIENKNGGGTVLSAYTYTYDSASRVTSQRHWGEVGTVVYSGTNSYTYDAASQLLSDGTSTYSYDAGGNRNMAGYATGTDNEMTTDGTYTYTYDAVGNVIEKSEGTGEQTWFYAYDNENHLVSARETSDGTTNVAWSTFTYDALGERVAEQDWTSGGGGTTTRFVLDGSNVAVDLDGSNNALVRYLYGAGVNQILTRTVASGANAGPWVYLTDNQGSVRDLVNWSGQVEDHLGYSGYGVLTETNAAVGSRYGYDGYQYQVTMGLDYTWARWYNPSTGNWQTQDPISFAAGQSNLYEYVENSATNAVDPSGELIVTVPVLIIVGGAAAGWWLFGPGAGVAQAPRNSRDIKLHPPRSWKEDAVAGLPGAAAGGTAGGAVVAGEAIVAAAIAKIVQSCFPAGTPVHTPVGLKPIDQIVAGGRVWAYDHLQLRWAERNVIDVYQLLHQGPMATVTVKGETLRATGGHPFWVVRGEDLADRPKPMRISAYEVGGRQEGRWVLGRDLRAGDEVLLRHGEIAAIESVRVDDVEELVYNFRVDELQNYAVGDWGVLVHNTNDKIKRGPKGGKKHTPGHRPDHIQQQAKKQGAKKRSTNQSAVESKMAELRKKWEALTDEQRKLLKGVRGADPSVTRPVDLK